MPLSRFRVVDEAEDSLLHRLAEALDTTEDVSEDARILQELQDIRGLLQVLLRREAGRQSALPPRRNEPRLYVQSEPTVKGYPFRRSGKLPARAIDQSDASRTLSAMMTLDREARRDFAC